MSATKLREAAALMREHQQGAAGLWAGATHTIAREPGRHGAVEFIRAWSPAVALAVADWLETTADRHSAILESFAPGSKAGAITAAENVDGWTQALKVAAAYLGTALDAETRAEVGRDG